MSILFESWIHGNAIELKNPSHLNSHPEALERFPESVHLREVGTSLRYYYSVPTPAVFDFEGLEINNIMIRFKSFMSSINWIRVSDGETEIWHQDFSHQPIESLDWIVKKFTINDSYVVKWGIGIEIGVHFGEILEETTTVTINGVTAVIPTEFAIKPVFKIASVGCDFRSSRSLLTDLFNSI